MGKLEVNRIHLAMFLLLGLLSLGTVSCALYTPDQTKPITKECYIPDDQAGTISGKWNTTPIPIAFFQGHFDSTETADMVKAADTWNKFFTASKEIPMIDYGTDPAAPRTSSVANPTQGGALCANGLLQGNQFSGQVVIYKLGRWPTSYAQNAIALTSFCTLPAKPYSKMYMAVMEINYQSFFIQGQKLPDLQSIFLHELGHLIGLNHSCEAAKKTGTPNCNDGNLNPDYVTASMYPVFTFDTGGVGQQKRDLGLNDQSRANCLY
jgi:hypothetical protein